MRLLLDTHVLLWSQSDPERLGPAREVLLNPANELFVSTAAAWEIAIKTGTGKLRLPVPAASWWPTRLAALQARALSIEPDDVLSVAGLPHLHRDPFDRLMIAQARRRDLRLVTGDQQVWAYGGDLLEVR